MGVMAAAFVPDSLPPAITRSRRHVQAVLAQNSARITTGVSAHLRTVTPANGPDQLQ